MTDQERELFLSCRINETWDCGINTQGPEYLPILEIRERDKTSIYQAFLYYDIELDPDFLVKDDDLFLLDSDLSNSTINMCNVLIPKIFKPRNSSSIIKPKLVYNASTIRNLARIALSISMKSPILLQGSAGVGKTCLIEEAAAICQQGLI